MFFPALIQTQTQTQTSTQDPRDARPDATRSTRRETRPERPEAPRAVTETQTRDDATNANDATRKQKQKRDDGNVADEKEKGDDVLASAAFESLDVPPTIKALFSLMDAYTPTHTRHATPLKPFVPAFIPAVGDVDEFVKVPRPDGKDDGLGTRVLDEPGAKQTDPAAFALQLRHAARLRGEVPVSDPAGESGGGGKGGGFPGDDGVAVVAFPERDPARLTSWIETVKGLHASGVSIAASGSGRTSLAAAPVRYSRNMPDVESLMQAWDGDTEEVLRGVRLPDASLPMPLRKRAELACATLGVPVYENLVESMHVVFSTYLEFKNNPFLKKGKV